MKLLAVIALAVVSAVSTPKGASADDTLPVCSAEYIAVGPYCVAPVYVNNPLFVDPATCEHGYFQGSCAPEPRQSVDLGEAAYTFQTPTPAPAEPTPVDEPVAAIVEPVVEHPAPRWLGQVRLASGVIIR